MDQLYRLKIVNKCLNVGIASNVKLWQEHKTTEFSFTKGEIVKGVQGFLQHCIFFYVKHILATWPVLDNTWKKWNRVHAKIFTHIHSSFIHQGSRLKLLKMPTDWWIDEQLLIHLQWNTQWLKATNSWSVQKLGPISEPKCSDNDAREQ